MPQLIAMIIVVVGAMIYMFQTFGGTGDKIEGIAQKTSVITEINNIKTGVKLAARSEEISTEVDNTDPLNPKTTAANLKGLADLKYFAEQINDQISNNNVTTAPDTAYEKENAYNAISFGGTDTQVGGMFISLVADKKGAIPGIFVSFNFEGSTLKESGGFLESQIATDLKDVAYIDRHAVEAKSGAFTAGTGRTDTNDKSEISKRTPENTAASTGSESDGKFIIYFKDFGSNEVVK
ncbi:MAG: hypothetical protein PHQ70_01150 [Arcobacter sp.]|uniref:hypothetical protein n=1 Tax=Arcobacter sp. TaxID=1872629 RepID=UPI002584B336|nr:hypothetical protein [Arcobacter sp.]MDD3007450.1 hypothetical protein [Arcobacter sp.]